MYLKGNRLPLADGFQEFREMCLEIYQLDPGKFLSAQGLSWLAALKKTELELELLTDTDMLSEVKKGIRCWGEGGGGGWRSYVTVLIDMQKLIINIWKNMIRLENCHILNIGT